MNIFGEIKNKCTFFLTAVRISLEVPSLSNNIYFYKLYYI